VEVDNFYKIDGVREDLKRYLVISEYYRENPNRISENTDYITDIAKLAMISVRDLRAGPESDLEYIMSNFGIVVWEDENEFERLILRN